MQRRDLNALDAYLPVAAYTQAIEVSGATRTLYISGQIGHRMDGTIPDDIAEQSRLAWQNLAAPVRAGQRRAGASLAFATSPTAQSP
jgi:enamine deaminase RidA (YjgF/YER057c/UK114 family)